MLVFSQFSSDMDSATQDMLHYGARLTEMLVQKNNAPIDMAVQVAFLYAMSRGLVPHTIDMGLLHRFKAEFPALLRENYPTLLAQITLKQALDDGIESGLQEATAAWLREAGA
jgi:F-type H+-transporting ATPase subunit alpha